MFINTVISKKNAWQIMFVLRKNKVVYEVLQEEQHFKNILYYQKQSFSVKKNHFWTMLQFSPNAKILQSIVWHKVVKFCNNERKQIVIVCLNSRLNFLKNANPKASTLYRPYTYPGDCILFSKLKSEFGASHWRTRALTVRYDAFSQIVP
jgi:hypothetical protein